MCRSFFYYTIWIFWLQLGKQMPVTFFAPNFLEIQSFFGLNFLEKPAFFAPNFLEIQPFFGLNFLEKYAILNSRNFVARREIWNISILREMLIKLFLNGAGNLSENLCFCGVQGRLESPQRLGIWGGNLNIL